MSVRLLFLRVVTGFMTCAPTRKAPTCAIVTTRVIAGLKIAVHARVSNMRNINPCPAELLHLKLELLTQFPASNDEKYYYL